MKSLRLLPALLAVLVLAAPAAGAGSQPRVLAIEFDNDVNPVTADYVTDAARTAPSARATTRP